MPGNLAAYLKERLATAAPRGWTASIEERLLPDHLAARYGFSPHADLLFRKEDGTRVAIELEISRADPVANQAKFLVAADVGALGASDILVSMMSSHVVRGRRNVASAFTRYLRSAGLQAFQVSLLPSVQPADIARLNHCSPTVISRAHLPVRDESARLASVIEPRGARRHRIHFAGDVADVVANVWSWNDGLQGNGPEWGKRQVQFFVYDECSGLFAPAKYCAFVPAALGDDRPPATMTFQVYTDLGEQDPRFDGHVARVHLVKRLAFSEVALQGEVKNRFWGWMARADPYIKLRQPVRVLLPPSWY